MGHESASELLVFHALRLKRFAEPAEIAEQFDIDESVAAETLRSASAAELVAHREGRIGGFHLTPAGVEHAKRLLADEVVAAGAEAAVTDAHRRFLGMNLELLSICTDWQVRDGGTGPAPNDHLDPVYDDAVIERLGQLHAAICPVLDDLSDALHRFVGYRVRLSNALDRLRSGEVDYFTKPMFPSYHSVWFELHEDLLATLDIDRSAEAELRS